MPLRGRPGVLRVKVLGFAQFGGPIGTFMCERPYRGAFAGRWYVLKHPGGNRNPSCAISTTAASHLLAESGSRQAAIRTRDSVAPSNTTAQMASATTVVVGNRHRVPKAECYGPAASSVYANLMPSAVY